jgi:hypothetical protein
MSSAWLIRRFIDPDAQFAFAADRRAVPTDTVPLDMFGVELPHRGDRCTFETLRDVFRITGSAITRLTRSCTTSISRTDVSARRRRLPSGC